MIKVFIISPSIPFLPPASANITTPLSRSISSILSHFIHHQLSIHLALLTSIPGTIPHPSHQTAYKALQILATPLPNISCQKGGKGKEIGREGVGWNEGESVGGNGRDQWYRGRKWNEKENKRGNGEGRRREVVWQERRDGWVMCSERGGGGGEGGEK